MLFALEWVMWSSISGPGQKQVWAGNKLFLRTSWAAGTADLDNNHHLILNVNHCNFILFLLHVLTRKMDVYSTPYVQYVSIFMFIARRGPLVAIIIMMGEREKVNTKSTCGGGGVDGWLKNTFIQETVHTLRNLCNVCNCILIST